MAPAAAIVCARRSAAARGAGAAGRAGPGRRQLRRRRREEPGEPAEEEEPPRAREKSRSGAMPAAAGDGLLGEPAAPGGGGGGGGAEDAARPAAACEGSFLPAWVSGVPRERLRDFQHHKRVGNYLIGSRKLGEGSFAKVREGLHVLTGEKVSRPGRWPWTPAPRPGREIGAGGAAGTLRAALCCESGRGALAPHLPAPPAFPLGLNAGSSQTRAPALADQDTGISQRGYLGSLSPVGYGGLLVSPRSRRQLFVSRRAPPGGHQRWVGVQWGDSALGPIGAARSVEKLDPGLECVGPEVEGGRAD